MMIFQVPDASFMKVFKKLVHNCYKKQMNTESIQCKIFADMEKIKHNVPTSQQDKQ